MRCERSEPLMCVRCFCHRLSRVRIMICTERTCVRAERARAASGASQRATHVCALFLLSTKFESRSVKTKLTCQSSCECKQIVCTDRASQARFMDGVKLLSLNLLLSMDRRQKNGRDMNHILKELMPKQTSCRVSMEMSHDVG